MNKKHWPKFCILILLSLGVGCGTQTNDAGTGVSNPPDISTTQTQQAAAAVGAVFADHTMAAAGLLEFLLRTAYAQNCPSDPKCTCEKGINEEVSSFGVESSPFKTSGIYGSSGGQVQLDAEEFCTLPDGTQTGGGGPGGLGVFAGFVFTRDLEGSCQGGGNPVTVAIKEGSEGIWRVTAAANDEPAHEPEIYGHFILELDGVKKELDCTLFLASDHTLLFAECEKDGIVVEQSLSAICQF